MYWYVNVMCEIFNDLWYVWETEYVNNENYL